MRFGVLGTLVVTDDDGQPLRPGGPARRRLLAALVARAGATVTVDTLVEDLWSGVPPATAEKTLQSHVVRLRHDLARADGTSPIVTEPAGYRLDVEPSCVDAWCFERDVAAGRRAVVAGDLPAAAELLDEALARWRGEAYAEFPDAVFAVSERLRLGELRSLAQESYADVALALGGGGELVADLEARLRLEPYLERSWEQLMLALYRAGRQGDALAAYRRARRRLVDDLGVEPSTSLTLLEQRILDQDPDLLAVTPLAGSPVLSVDDGVAHVAAPPRQVTAGEGTTAVDGACPYRGLASYLEDDADVFVGRERLTAELAGRLVDDELLVVVGPSGAGKSSLIRAGLLPALRAGAIPGSAVWRSRVVTPSSMDTVDLDDLRVDLLVLDQAEELFTLADPSLRSAVAHALTSALAGGSRVVIVLRADFYGRLSELDLATGRIGSATMLVGPLSEEETRRVATEPAARHGVTVDPALCDRVVADTQGSVGSLPLLSASLERAWQRRTGDRLTLEDYLSGGGVRGALESMAEDVYSGLDDAGRAAARRLLLRMTTFSHGVWTRRPLPLADAAPPDDAPAAAVLAALARGRLVTVADSTAELAHESLLVGWPRLRSWLDDRAVMAEQLEHLAATAAAWDDDGRPETDLLRGPRLQAGLDWSRRHPDDLSPREHAYLSASRDAIEAGLRKERSRRRALTVATAMMAAAALVATVVGAAAVRQKAEADAVSLSADARRLAAQSYVASDIPTAMQLAAAAYTLEDSPDARGALLTAVQRESGVLFRVRTDHPLLWVAAPTEGGPILVMDDTRTVLRIDPATRDVSYGFRVFDGVTPTSVSPDGRTLAVADSGWPTDPGGVYLFDVQSGAFERVLSDQSIGNGVTPPTAFTLDGRHIVGLEHRVEGSTPPSNAGLQADTVAVYDTARGALVGRALMSEVAMTGIATSLDRFALSYADGSVEIRSADDLALIDHVHLPSAVTGLALSPDGTRLGVVLSSLPLTPQLLTVGRLSAAPRSGQGLAVAAKSLSFSRDGALLSATGADGSLLVLATHDLTTVASDIASGSTVTATAWGGTTVDPELLATGLDGQLVSHTLGELQPTIRVGAQVRPSTGQQVQCGSLVVSTETLADGSRHLRRMDLSSGTVTASWPIPLQAEETVQWLSASSDGTRAVVSTQLGGGRAHIRVWDMSSGRVLLDRTQRWVFWELPLVSAISADGRTLVQGTGWSTLDLVDVDSGAVRRTLTVHLSGPDGSAVFPMPLAGDDEGTITVLGYAPSRRLEGDMAVGLGDALTPIPDQQHTIAVIDASDGFLRAVRDLGPSWVTATSWSPDGTLLALGLESGAVAEYEASSLAPVHATVIAHGGAVSTVSYSPDGSILVSAGIDGRMQLWDSASLRPLGPPIRLGVLAGVSAWYRADTAITGIMPSSRADRLSDTVFTMPGAPSSWLGTACEAAGGSLSPGDWARYVGDRPYVESCSQGS